MPKYAVDWPSVIGANAVMTSGKLVSSAAALESFLKSGINIISPLTMLTVVAPYRVAGGDKTRRLLLLGPSLTHEYFGCLRANAIKRLQTNRKVFGVSTSLEELADTPAIVRL